MNELGGHYVQSNEPDISISWSLLLMYQQKQKFELIQSVWRLFAQVGRGMVREYRSDVEISIEIRWINVKL